VPRAFRPPNSEPNDVFPYVVAQMFAVLVPVSGLATSRFVAGKPVPIPMLPLVVTRKRDVPPIMKLIDPFNWFAPFRAMLLMRYSCVELLKPWNCPSTPF
jgi:hypothetical protein